MTDDAIVAQKLLQDELVAEKAKCTALIQRLSLAYSALHVECHAHEQTKATLTRLQRKLAKAKVNINEIDDE